MPERERNTIDNLRVTQIEVPEDRKPQFPVAKTGLIFLVSAGLTTLALTAYHAYENRIAKIEPVQPALTPLVDNHILTITPTLLPIENSTETPPALEITPTPDMNLFKIGDFDFGPFTITVPAETSKVLFEITSDSTFSFDEPLYQIGRNWNEIDKQTFEKSAYRQYGENAYFVLRTSTPNVITVIAHSDIPFLFPGEIARMAGITITTDPDGTQHLSPRLMNKPLEIQSKNDPTRVYNAEIIGGMNITNEAFNDPANFGVDGVRLNDPFMQILPNLNIPSDIINFRSDGNTAMIILGACQSADLVDKPHTDAAGHLVPNQNSALMSLLFIKVDLNAVTATPVK